MNTGLRPIRSASMPNSGWVTSANDVGDHDQPHGDGGVQADLLAVGDGESSDDCRDRGDERAEEHPDDVFPVVLQQRLERHPGDRAGGLRLVELGCLVQPPTDEVGHHDDDCAEPERNSPAPRELGVVGQRDERNHHQRGQDQAALGAGQRPRRVERAAVIRGVLEGERTGARLLTCGGEALQQSHRAPEAQARASRRRRRWAGSRSRRSTHPSARA